MQANDEVFFQKDGLKFFRSGDLGRIVENKVRTCLHIVRTHHMNKIRDKMKY